MTAQRFDTDQTDLSIDEASEVAAVPGSSSATAPMFDDGKDPEALRTIGEVAKALGIRQHVLRYWEEQFPALLRPVKRSGNRRYYRPEDVALIARIDQLVHREGYTLKGAAKALSGAAKTAARATVRTVPVTGPAPAPVAASAPMSAEFIVRLTTLRDRLAHALEVA